MLTCLQCCACDESVFVVADNRIGDEGVKALADALKSNASVTNVNLESKKTLNSVSAFRTRLVLTASCFSEPNRRRGCQSAGRSTRDQHGGDRTGTRS